MNNELLQQLTEKQRGILDYLVKKQMIIQEQFGAGDLEKLISYIEGMEIVVEGKRLEEERRSTFITPRFKLGAVLDATGANKLKLRNWLTRGQLQLHANAKHQKQGWRLFSMRDTIQIALASKLSNLAVPISDINEITIPVLECTEKLLTSIQGIGFTPIFVVTNDDGWNIDMRRKWIGSAPIEDDPLPSPCIYLDPIAIVQDVMKSLDQDFMIVRPT